MKFWIPIAILFTMLAIVSYLSIPDNDPAITKIIIETDTETTNHNSIELDSMLDFATEYIKNHDK